MLNQLETLSKNLWWALCDGREGLMENVRDALNMLFKTEYQNRDEEAFRVVKLL